MQCPNGHPVEESTAKFCLECGTKLVELPQAPSGGGVEVGEKAVVAGDVTGGDRVEMKSHGGDQHFHQAVKDETKEVQRCASCGGRRPTVDGHDCPGCNSFVCNECYHMEEERCVLCEKEAMETYQQRLGEAYADGNVGGSERQELNRLADELRISKERLKELEAPFRQKRDQGGAGGLSRMDQITFKKAQQLLEEFKTGEALAKLKPLYDKHGDAHETVREAYLLTLVEENQDELLSETQRILDDKGIDDAIAYLCRGEAFMRQEDLSRADEENKKAQTAFPNDIRFKAQEAKILLETYRKEEEEDYLSTAGEILQELGEDVKEDPYAYSVHASYTYAVEGGKVEHFWEAEENLDNAGLSTWFVVRKIRELKLETKAEAEARAKVDARAKAETEARAKAEAEAKAKIERLFFKIQNPTMNLVSQQDVPFIRSARKGDAGAAFHLAKLFLGTRWVQPNDELYKSWLTIAAATGHERAASCLEHNIKPHS